MFKKIDQKIPANSVSYILICGGIIILIILLGIIPLYHFKSSRIQEAKKIQDQIEEQKELRTVYQLLDQASNKKESLILPNPAKEKLPRKDVVNFQDIFRREAARSGLVVIALIPDSKSTAGSSPHFIYNATMKGDFANFRKMLVGLGNLPYVDQIPEIALKQGSDSMEFKVKIWIALAN